MVWSAYFALNIFSSMEKKPFKANKKRNFLLGVGSMYKFNGCSTLCGSKVKRVTIENNDGAESFVLQRPLLELIREEVDKKVVAHVFFLNFASGYFTDY